MMFNTTVTQRGRGVPRVLALCSMLLPGVCIARPGGESGTLEAGAAACLEGRVERLMHAPAWGRDSSVLVDESTGRSLLNYPPHPIVDYRHMALDIVIPDMNVRRFDAVQRLSFAPIAGPLDELTLDARLLTIRGVRVNARECRFSHDGRTLRISFDPALPAGTPAELQIDYTLENPQEGLFWTPESPAWPGRPAQIHTQGQPETNSYWFPCHDFPNVRLTTELRVSVPSGYEVSSNGRFLGRSSQPGPVATPGAMETFHFAQDDQAGGPHSNYLVSLIVGKFDIVDVAGMNVPFRRPGASRPLMASAADFMPVYVPPGRAGDVAGTYGRTARMARFFADRFDEPYPYAKYAQLVVHNFGAGGMENTSATTMYDTAIIPRDQLGDSDLDGLISHELAHQWFGDLITCRSWEHIWLNEGFATFLTALWLEARDGLEAYQTQIRQNFESVISADTGTAPETPGVVSKIYAQPWDVFRKGSNPYPKGASVLHMLRRKLGDDIFFRGVAQYVDAFKGRNAETRDLRLVLEAVSGENLEQFFVQWLERPNIPRLNITTSFDSSSQAIVIEVRQTQPIDQFNPAFAFDLPVRVVRGSKSTQHTFLVNTTTTRFTIPASTPADFIEFDPDQSVLAQFIIAQPSGAALAQAQRAQSLPARLQALDQIVAAAGAAGAAGSTAGGSAFGESDGVRGVMAKIVASESEPVAVRTRALDALIAAKAWQPIADVLKSSKLDLRVRAAGVNGLATIASGDNTEVVPTIITALARELENPSHRVRAAVLRGLGKIKQPASVSIALQYATRDPRADAHDDLVRSAALQALGDLDDPQGLAAALDLAGPGVNTRTRGRAIQTLGVLAKHDPSRVMPELGGMLADPEARPRNAAADALFTIGDARALSLLEARTSQIVDPAQRDVFRVRVDALRAKLAPPTSAPEGSTSGASDTSAAISGSGG